MKLFPHEVSEGVAEFSVWAPQARSVDVVFADARHPLRPCGSGRWKVALDAVRAGEPYR